ncbi:MAG TPA: DUF2520 domain-containing protein [Chitinophagales bacterium]|nr:DUF2520 domain-containing protein [Chitinophagales bacterium]HRK28985.1 DUF2520 domain-containing protein [Chitinophagales bacterium]
MANIVLIGFGNVGQHLCKALHAAGHTILQVVTKQSVPNQAFTTLLPHTQWITQYNQINPDAHFYLIAVPDNAIGSVALQLPHTLGIVAHTSGSTPLTALGNHPNTGIFYPLQTFTKHHAVNFDNIPFCIHANNEPAIAALDNLAKTLSPMVFRITDEQRSILHVAAVFANNFTNHLCAIAHQICTQYEMPFEVIKPLIAETCRKIQTNLPQTIQTGPAIRSDYNTLLKHLQLLHNQPRYAQLYKELTLSILNMYNLNTEPIHNALLPDG